MTDEDANEIVLTQDNKEEVADLLGYPMETIDNILAKAEEKGFKGVKLPILKH